MQSEGLSLIVPVYNEKDEIQNTIYALEKIKFDAKFPLQIILVNDGSVDGTGEIMKNFSDQFVVLHHEFNMGYGASLKTGIKASQFDYVSITDADATYPNERFPEFFHLMLEGDLDMVVGARTGNNVNIPLIRRPAKYFLNKLANYLAKKKIPDLNSGMRIMRKSTVISFINILPDGFSFTTTITLAMLTNNYKVKYIPIDYNHRVGNSKIRPIYDTFNFIQLIIRTVLYFDPLKVFLPISLVFFLISLLLLLYRIFIERDFGVTSVLFFIGAFQLLAMGMLADLIDKRIANTSVK